MRREGGGDGDAGMECQVDINILTIEAAQPSSSKVTKSQ